MVHLSKKIAVVSILVLVMLGALLVESCVAPIVTPTNPKAAPEVISVVIHNNPVWEPPITNTNPYTGEVISTQPGYWIYNGSIEITLKNRPFTAYTDENGNTINTYYCIFYKLLNSNFGWLGTSPGGGVSLPIAIYQSDTAHTVIPFKYGDESGWGLVGDVSFRIQTVEEGYFIHNQIYEGVGSVWTEFTITIPQGDHTSSILKPTIKPTTVMPSTSDSNILPPSNPYSSWLSYLVIILVAVCIIVISVGVVVYFNRQHRKTIPLNGSAGVVCEVSAV
ncbi:MAG: hypothetical protein FWD52_00230 [Candidatus Bathyarchaeota archaeon]|nr:hypothetical protein [Candidatus Termiticorpusculum sp.]